MAEDFRRQHCDALLSRIAEFRSSDDVKFSDIDVNVSGIVFKCHRLVLSAASEYFNAMFSGNFNESSKSEITLHGIEADVFKEVLQFLYTGDFTVNSLNVYGLICAAEYYQLPIVGEICITFLQENWNAVARDVLKIYSFAHAAANEKLVCLLSPHIHKHFAYFSTTPEYSQLTFDSLMKVFCQPKSKLPILQDIYLEGIFSWIALQQGLDAAERESYYEKLSTKIDFGKLSVEYTQYKLMQSMKNLNVSTAQSTDDVGEKSYIEIYKHPALLHAYMSKHSIGDFAEEESSLPLSIFTLRQGVGTHTMSNARDWVHSGEMEFCSDYMKNIVFDEHLYSLSYSKKSNDGNGPGQVFCCGSSIFLYPYKSLKPPPMILANFELCGEKNDIYVSSRDVPLIPNRFSADSTFSEHDLKCGIFIYKRDVDRWFPLPSPKTRYYNASMAYFENIVYLVGGPNNSNKTAQAYDPRTQVWVSLPCTTGTYDHAMCFPFQNKICVSDIRVEPSQTEFYDPVSNSWQPLREDENYMARARPILEALFRTNLIYDHDYKFKLKCLVTF